MIVRQFLHWVRTAPAGERAEATGALARAYLYSDLSNEDRDAAEGAMIMLLDDASPLVRQALAEALAGSPDAPHAVIHALASDHADIAALVLARSPPRSPRSAPPRRASSRPKTPMPRLRRPHSTGSSRGSDASARSARRC